MITKYLIKFFKKGGPNGKIYASTLVFRSAPKEEWKCIYLILILELDNLRNALYTDRPLDFFVDTRMSNLLKLYQEKV